MSSRVAPPARPTQASAYWQAQKKPVQSWPGGHVPPQIPNRPPQVNPSVVDVVDDVDVVVDSSTGIELVEVELLLVVVGSSVVRVEAVVADVVDVAPGSVLLVVVGLAVVVVVVLVVEARVVDGRLVVVTTVAG